VWVAVQAFVSMALSTTIQFLFDHAIGHSTIQNFHPASFFSPLEDMGDMV